MNVEMFSCTRQVFSVEVNANLCWCFLFSLSGKVISNQEVRSRSLCFCFSAGVFRQKEGKWSLKEQFQNKSWDFKKSAWIKFWNRSVFLNKGFNKTRKFYSGKVNLWWGWGILRMLFTSMENPMVMNPPPMRTGPAKQSRQQINHSSASILIGFWIVLL